jgi:hypothetical protein
MKNIKEEDINLPLHKEMAWHFLVADYGLDRHFDYQFLAFYRRLHDPGRLLHRGLDRQNGSV